MYTLCTNDEKYHFVGLNSTGEFVFENTESHLSFWTMKAKDLFFSLAVDEFSFCWGDYNTLDLDDVKTLYHKLMNKSYHHSY